MNANEIWKSSSPRPELAVKEFIGYPYQEYLENLVKDKTVAFICPSPHLVGQKSGAFIDSHDVVVRAGNLGDIPETLHEDYGSRTDILVGSFNELEVEEAKRNIDFFKKLKYVLCSMVSTDFIEKHTEFFQMLTDYGCKTENVDDRYLFDMFRDIGTIANCGLSGLVILLKYPIKSVYVTGMSFYNWGEYGKVYNDQYYDVVTNKSKLYTPNGSGTTTAEQARQDIHNQEAQITYFKHLCKTDSRILLDNYLKERISYE